MSFVADSDTSLSMTKLALLDYASSSEDDTEVGRNMPAQENKVRSHISQTKSTPTASTVMSPSAQQEQLLGPESVVINNQLHEELWGSWDKLPDDDPLAQLHAKFWRKSMVDEENEWREARRNSVGNPSRQSPIVELTARILMWISMMRSVQVQNRTLEFEKFLMVRREKYIQ